MEGGGFKGGEVGEGDVGKRGRWCGVRQGGRHHRRRWIGVEGLIRSVEVKDKEVTNGGQSHERGRSADMAMGKRKKKKTRGKEGDGNVSGGDEGRGKRRKRRGKEIDKQEEEREWGREDKEENKKDLIIERKTKMVL